MPRLGSERPGRVLPSASECLGWARWLAWACPAEWGPVQAPAWVSERPHVEPADRPPGSALALEWVLLGQGLERQGLGWVPQGQASGLLDPGSEQLGQVLAQMVRGWEPQGPGSVLLARGSGLLLPGWE